MTTFGTLFGVMKTFMQMLEDEVVASGGTAEMLERLGKKSLRPAIKRFAEEIVREAGALASSFRDMIRLGRYDYTYGYADNPEGIEGQTFHAVTNETELDHPGKRFTTKQVYQRYGDKMADLSELLDYGIKNPDTQRQLPIGIVWKVGDQFWYAILSSSGSLCELDVNQGYPDIEWNDYFRFLVRK